MLEYNVYSDSWGDLNLYTPIDVPLVRCYKLTEDCIFVMGGHDPMDS